VAFDMYLDDRHEAIRDADQYIFSLASEPAGAYPALGAVWSRFYSQFSIEPVEAERLVRELLALYAEHGRDAGPGYAELTLRLACFFSRAAVSGSAVRCAGD